MAETQVSKSYQGSDPVKAYCLNNSTPLHPVQTKLMEDTLKIPRAGMLGAPEVISLNAILIKAMGAKKVLDIGVFTGASSLAAALALPEDGRVLACDVSEEWTNRAKEYWRQAGVQDKIELVLAPATETLEARLERGEGGTFDFAFIDADKSNYDNYYEQCLKLLRQGGMIVFDNTLWSGLVLKDCDPSDVDTAALKALNTKIGRDPRVTAVQMIIGDGVTLVTIN